MLKATIFSAFAASAHSLSLGNEPNRRLSPPPSARKLRELTVNGLNILNFRGDRELRGSIYNPNFANFRVD